MDNAWTGGASDPLSLALAHDDIDLAELVTAWPKLAAKQRRQLLLLVRSMVR